MRAAQATRRPPHLDGEQLCPWMLAVSTFILSVGCEPHAVPQPSIPASPAPANSQAEIIEVEFTDLSLTVTVPASVEGYETAVLKSRLEAYVGEVLVDIGDEVKKDDLLARLDVPEMVAEEDRLRKLVAKARADLETRRAELQQAEARRSEHEALLRLRETEFKKIDGLVRSGALTRERLDEAQFALDAQLAAVQRVDADIAAGGALVKAAEADIDVANAELRKTLALASYLEIRAPFDGLITERQVDPGELVRPGNDGGSTLLKIENVSKLRVVFYLPMDKVAAELDRGDAVQLRSISRLPGEKFSGQISRFAKSFNRNSRMMRAEVDLENPLDEQTNLRKLHSGDYGTVTVMLADCDCQDIAAVPRSAIAEDDAGRFVIEVGDDQVCRRRSVVIKAERGNAAGVVQPNGEKLTAQRVIAKEVRNFKDGQQLSVGKIRQ